MNRIQCKRPADTAVLTFGPMLLLGLCVAMLTTGCRSTDIVTTDKLKNGLVVVLPGIEGRSRLNRDIVRGLQSGGVDSAIEIYDWGTGTPFGFLIHLTALNRNRHEAKRLARRILSYQNNFPGRPVHLVGHSGGGGVLLLTLEYLPAGSKITSAVLLAGAVSRNYDLRRALDRTEFGIWNFYSTKDIGFLTIGTSIFGTIDRAHGRAAGAAGFKEPTHLSKKEEKEYSDLLHQIPYSKKMRKSGNYGSHFGWANPRFVRDWIAPIFNQQIAQIPRKNIHLSKAKPVDLSMSPPPTDLSP